MSQEYWLVMTVRQKSYSSRPLIKRVLTKKQLKAALKPLYGFSGRIIEPIGPISLPISFGTLCNAHTEYITFNVVDMHYPYNIIFCSGLLNTFETALHSTYLQLKVPAASGVISNHGN
jgi:hypothetical protein